VFENHVTELLPVSFKTRLLKEGGGRWSELIWLRGEGKGGAFREESLKEKGTSEGDRGEIVFGNVA